MIEYPKKPDSVYYFGTCLVDLIYPQAGMAGIRLIQREGVEVIFPQKQTCCGQPAFNAGHQHEALAGNPAEYSWSSYHINASDKPSALCKPHAEYLKLGETRSVCAENYKLKCESGLKEKRLEEIRNSINKGLAFGDEKFKIEVEKLTGRRQRALKSGRPVGWRKEK